MPKLVGSVQGKLPPHHTDSAMQLLTGSGVTVGANRGASGIDGVLSSAAGFAEGLARGTTLVVRLTHLSDSETARLMLRAGFAVSDAFLGL